jgi:WhiB family transcriptional regulator, redox-sensing transcriptional regulator
MTATWQGSAACAGMNPEIFFPTGRRDSEKARRICKGCPVISECLAAALRVEIELPAADRYSVSGVRGGVDGTARLRMVLRQRRLLGIRNSYEDDLEDDHSIGDAA